MMATATETDTAALFKAAHFHRYEIFHSTQCACYSCFSTFQHEQIVEWTDKDMTALCPHCGADAVLPDYNETPIDRETLEALNHYAF